MTARSGRWLAAVLLLASASACAADVASAMAAAGAADTGAADTVVTRPTELRVDRYVDAKAVRTLAADTRVTLLRTEAGWVQVRVDGVTGWMRATGLIGDAASVAALAKLDSGRSATGNIATIAGVRRIPKASKHALLVGVDAVEAGRGTSALRWPGVAVDMASARLIARRIGVPEDNVDVVFGPDATLDGIGQALERLDRRVQPGDQVLVYWSGPGGAIASPSPCTASWSTSDGGSLSAAAIVQHLRSVLADADKLLFVADVGYPLLRAGPPQTGRKATASSPGNACGPRELPLVAAAGAIGAAPQNVVAMQAAGPQQGVDDPQAGGLFTQAILDCFLGDAIDADGSASLSIGEIASCAGPRAAASGNARYSPVVGAFRPPSGPMTADAPSPRATIDDLFAQRDARVAVTMTASTPALRIGRDALDLTLTSTRAGFVYLVLLGSDQKSFYLLFPNDLDGDNAIDAGQTMRLPRPHWRVQAQGPPGADTVLAIVAESKRDPVAFATTKVGPFGTATNDAPGRAALQWLLGRSAQADDDRCVDAGRRRNLAAVTPCSDAFGAAILTVVEQ